MTNAQLQNIGLGSGDGGTKATVRCGTDSGERLPSFATTTSNSRMRAATDSLSITTASTMDDSVDNATQKTDDKAEYPTTWYRWLVLAVFSFVASGNGMAFMAYGAAEAEFTSYYDGACERGDVTQVLT